MDDILSNIKLAANGTPYKGLELDDIDDTYKYSEEEKYDPFEAGVAAGKYQANIDIHSRIQSAWQEGFKQGFTEGCNYWESRCEKGKVE